jgi:hypothetical protein
VRAAHSFEQRGLEGWRFVVPALLQRAQGVAHHIALVHVAPAAYLFLHQRFEFFRERHFHVGRLAQWPGSGNRSHGSGEDLPGDAVVVAADATTAARFIPGLVTKEPEWRAVTGLYFAAEKSPLREAIIALNGTGRGLVNNVCVLSDVAPGYAPPGQALISISVLGVPAIPDLETQILTELEPWFGPAVRGWRHLRTDRIERALPEQPPIEGAPGPCFREIDGIFVCGDHLTSASIEGAILSGLRTAEALLA